MKNWLLSLNGAITFSTISLMVFLGRAFIDFYYVYEEFGLSVGMVGGAILIHLALFGGWILGLLSAVQGSHRGLIAIFSLNLFFLLVIAVGTLVSYCPSPCSTGWPLGEIVIWASLVSGLVAAISSGFQIWHGSSQQKASLTQAEA